MQERDTTLYGVWAADLLRSAGFRGHASCVPATHRSPERPWRSSMLLTGVAKEWDVLIADSGIFKNSGSSKAPRWVEPSSVCPVPVS